MTAAGFRPLLLLALVAEIGEGQQLLAPRAGSGRTVTPVYEGWYANSDGTFSLSFGYYNRNAREAVDLPLGAANAITGAGTDGVQPTRFESGRHWGVFTVVVPADFGPTKRVTWSLTNGGETFAIPGGLHPDWQIDALEGEASSGNTPPAIRFSDAGMEGRGPGGLTAGPQTIKAGVPLSLSIWVKDDGRGTLNVASSARRDDMPVTLTWFRHQGPGNVTFTPPTSRVSAAAGMMALTATFDTPGQYVLRVRVNDASGVTGAGHAQCCWTNGFVRVTVTP
ncbi:MAG: hypothetical protein ACT4OZ_06205 [Gemmatimonadota bacterium]